MRRQTRRTPSGGHPDIYTRPTESESFEDTSDDDDDIFKDLESQSSADSDGGLQIATGYLKNSNVKRQGMTPVIPDEDRLIMLAKHPGATETQVTQALQRQRQLKNAKMQQKRQAKQQQRGVVFAPAYPENAYTNGQGQQQGDQSTSNPNNISVLSSGSAETSFDRIWQTDVDPEQYTAPTTGVLHSLWRKIRPSPRVRTTGSVVSKQSMAISMTSDKTPKISNVDRQFRDERIQKSQEPPTCADRCDQCAYRIFRRKRGIVVLILFLVLILAVVVTVVAALMTQDGNDPMESSIVSDDRQVFPGTSPPNTQPAPSSPPTVTPTSEPSSFPTVGEPDALPTSLTLAPTESRVSAAPVVVPTRTPTQSPTAPPTTSPTTLSPTTQSPTAQFSIRPAPTEPNFTASPSTSPTLSPTQRPSLAPTKAPTASPTIRQTESPSSSPTIGFASTQLQAVGTPLLGSQPEQRFGQAVALSQNGNVLAVGSPSARVDGNALAGKVEVFERTDRGWKRRGTAMTGRNEEDQFGTSIALSADGSVLIVAEPTFSGPAGSRSGNVRTYLYNEAVGYEQMGADLSGATSTEHFGEALAMSADGRRFAVGAPYHDNGGPEPNISGRVTILDYQDDGSWTESTVLAGTEHLDWFGWSLSMTDDGQVLCGGAPRNLEFGGYARCFRWIDSAWQALGSPLQNVFDPVRYDDNFGHALHVTQTSQGELRVAVGAPGKNGNALDAGLVAVYQFDTTTNDWKTMGSPVTLENPVDGDQMGFAVFLQEDILVVGSPGVGQVHRYKFLDSGEWELHPVALTGANGSSFGYSIQQRGEWLAIGSAETPGDNTGMVNVYRG